MTVRLRVFTASGDEISDEVEMRDGKSNPFGWSQYRLVRVCLVGEMMDEETVGWLESGTPMMETGYRAEVQEET